MPETLRRIVGLVARPSSEWDRIASAPTSVDRLIRRFIVPLSLLTPIATAVGMRTFDGEWDAYAGFFVPPELIFAASVTTLFTSIVSIFVLAGIFVAIAPMYGSSRNYRAALNVATYGAVPVLLAGVTLLLPAMVIVTMVGVCHSLFLYWIGVHRVLEVPAEANAEFVGVSMTMLAGISTIAGAMASHAGLF
jgi:hypothetical protein